jgi:dipeptidyl aminopeptidase/acylaminoacyl peptidase
MRIRSSLAVLAAASLPLVSAAQQSAAASKKRAFTPADWYRLTTVSSPALSPDGKRVAFTVTTVREAENKRHSEVWVASTSGGEPQRYTSPGTESSNPRWSPDGAYLFFTSKREGGKGTTWALRMDQPGGEATQLEQYPAGSVPLDRSFAVWSDTVTADSTADSSKTKDPFSAMAGTAHPPFGAITHPLDPKRFDGRHIVDLSYKSNDRGFLPNRWTPRRYNASQLWLQRFDGSPKRQLTNTPYSHRQAVVSPDGKWIAFVADSRLRPDSAVQAERDSLGRLPYDSARDNRARNDNDVYVVAVSGGEPRKVATLPGDENALAWSPDGSRIAVTAAPSRTESARIYTIGVRDGAVVNILGRWKYEPSNFFWLPSGDILFDAEVGGRSAVFRVSSRGGEPVELVGGRRAIRGLTMDPLRTRLAFASSSMDAPMELYVADADGRNLRRITSFNDKVSSEIAWSNGERFTYKSVGDVEIEGWLMKPYGYVPGKKYPLVLYIHGGPHASYDEGWFDEFQNLAGAGMFVLFTNPRGSYGYGADFTYATRGRWGAEDYQDLMKAVDIAAARPDVDSTRMGVTGGSYGGFMTAWITAHTNRFKAAETDRMISNWHSWYGSTDVQGLTEFEFFGKPWDNPALYDSLSPIRYVANVRTPTLMIQSEEDFRAPIPDAEQWYMALRKRGVPVEFVRYPRSTHELSRSGEPWLLVDRLGRLRQWFSYWLVDKPAMATR